MPLRRPPARPRKPRHPQRLRAPVRRGSEHRPGPRLRERPVRDPARNGHVGGDHGQPSHLRVLDGPGAADQPPYRSARGDSRSSSRNSSRSAAFSCSNIATDERPNRRFSRNTSRSRRRKSTTLDIAHRAASIPPPPGYDGPNRRQRFPSLATSPSHELELTPDLTENRAPTTSASGGSRLLTPSSCHRSGTSAARPISRVATYAQGTDGNLSLPVRRQLSPHVRALIAPGVNVAFRRPSARPRLPRDDSQHLCALVR
jgi:hypothetical protein